MLNAFNILELRYQWQIKLDNANQDIPNLNPELGKLSPPLIRWDVHREFHSYLLANTNENTIRAELIVLLNDMENTPIIPYEIMYNKEENKKFYKEEWRKLTRFNINRISK